MKTATYDNPITCARELWRDGVVVCFLSAVAIAKGEEPGLPAQLQGKGAFRPGRISGDATAVCTERRQRCELGADDPQSAEPSA